MDSNKRDLLRTGGIGLLALVVLASDPRRQLDLIRGKSEVDPRSTRSAACR